MKKHLNPNKEIVYTVTNGLKENDGYCPCVYESRGKPEYKCPCDEFKEKI